MYVSTLLKELIKWLNNMADMRRIVGAESSVA